VSARLDRGLFDDEAPVDEPLEHLRPVRAVGAHLDRHQCPTDSGIPLSCPKDHACNSCLGKCDCHLFLVSSPCKLVAVALSIIDGAHR
jgi:hypothetical protein